ncbi:DUF305 domain-containing protein [Nocardioides sp. W3-2-3]|uniref:DUF305 domain-containing protein n=1 Tax=Nocardioides convexus TaxID=2712224 RepID=UPI0024187030|nr:DUF305 domain-containing protein [Nocardioides convexus]NHA01067.1 DUF305 domain-containing protein [Nocardioides convexus]
MIQHHQGAIDMADAVLQAGEDVQVNEPRERDRDRPGCRDRADAHDSRIAVSRW